MKIYAGTGVRAGAGVLCAVVLLAGGVVANGGGRSGPLGAGEEVTVDADGLAVALDADGQPIPAELGPAPELAASPVVDDPMARIDQERRARAAVPTDPKAQPAAASLGADGPVEPEVDPDTLLVSFASGTSDADAAAALDRAGVQGERLAGSDTFEVTTAGADHAQLTEALEGQDAVEAVDANHIRTATRLPNDPSVGVQRSYLDGLGVPTAWDVANQGATVTVAVLDTGVDLDHPDLVGNLVPGYNAINPSAAPQDDNGHGTMVAGVIGAGTNNGNGVAGVAWNARIMPVKVLGADGRGNDADLVEGIRWAVDHGADVVNMSLGGPGGSSAIDYATLYAHGYDEYFEHAYPQNDVVLTAAAGNDAMAMANYPAAAFGVLGVTATDHSGNFAWFSNHGPWIDIAAPGIDITSTALTAGPNSGTGAGTGTSFSSPIVAAVAALVREEHPGWPWYKVEYEMLRSATDRGPAGYDDTYGFGVVSASGALGLTAFGTVSQPNLAGDAANFPASARAITVGSDASEGIAYEYDEDWFSFAVPQASSATVTVTPPAAADGYRAKEMDPMVEVYGPGGGVGAAADVAFLGEPETVQVSLAPGTHRIRVANYLGSSSPATYTVRVDLAPGPWAAPRFLLEDQDGWAVEVADFNDDGRNDVAVASTPSNTSSENVTLRVAHQGADGRLVLAQELASQATGFPGGLGDELTDVDVDDDGDLDLVYATSEIGLEVAWNDGGSLGTPTLYSATDGLNLVGHGDVDGTGPVDLVLSNAATGEVVAAHWTGSDFEVTSLFVGDRGWPEVGDLDGDGRTDVVELTPTQELRVHTAQADGSWAVTASADLTSATGTLYGLAVGDVSGDDRDDVVAVFRGAPGGSRLVSVLQGTGGTLGAPVLHNTTDGASGVAVGDLTGDGRADALVLQDGAPTGSSALHRQTANGTLGAAEPVPTATYNSFNSEPAIGDVDGDGQGDVVTATQFHGLQVVAHQAPPVAEGAGTWFASSNPGPHAVNVAANARPAVTFGRDIDPASLSYGPDVEDTVFLTDGRDGYLLPATLSRSGRTVTVTPSTPLQPGVPYRLTFWGVQDTAGEPVYQTFSFTTAAAAAPALSVNATYQPFRVDLDANGYDDVIWYSPSTALDPVWMFSPDGKVDAGKLDIRGTFRPVAGDFDGNGYEDVFWYSPGAGADVMWYHGPPDANGVITRQAVSYPVGGTYVPVAGDYNGDGYEDIFWHGPGTVADSVWRFRAGRAWSSVLTSNVTGTTYRLTSGDYTRDGYADVLWHQPGAPGESLWKGTATSFSGAPVSSVTGDYRLRSGDFNGDGFDDAYWYTAGKASQWMGKATTPFSSKPAPAIATTALPVAGDFNGDGRDDVYAYVPGTTADRMLPGKTTGL